MCPGRLTAPTLRQHHGYGCLGIYRKSEGYGDGAFAPHLASDLGTLGYGVTPSVYTPFYSKIHRIKAPFQLLQVNRSRYHKLALQVRSKPLFCRVCIHDCALVSPMEFM